MAAVRGDPARSFALEVARVADRILGDGLFGAYLGGSLALGEFVPQHSDIDVTLVGERSLAQECKRALVDVVSRLASHCPTRGLELVVYSRAEAAAPSSPPRFEVNLNAGPRMAFSVSFDPSSEPAHWFTIDLAMLREHGVALVGPSPERVFGHVARERLLEAVADCLAWHASNEPRSASSVLNACRAWRFAEEGVWSSKAEAARWLRDRGEPPALLESALEARRTGGRLDPQVVRSFIDRARDQVGGAWASGG